MFYPKTLNDPITTKISFTHATYERNLNQSNTNNGTVSPPNGRPKLVRKKSGEVVKSALKHYTDGSAPHSPKAVSFTSNLVRVRSYDKLECPQSVSGIIPMTMKVINFSSNSSFLESLPVVLESIELDKENSAIVGLIRVQNLCFAKEVLVRYSFDHWTSFQVIYAKYLRPVHLSAIQQDIFRFDLMIPPEMRVSNDPDEIHSIKFAIQFNCCGKEYWDNNQGRNYSIEITPNIEVDPDYMEQSVAIPLPKGRRSNSFDLASSYGASPDLSSPDNFRLNETKSQFGARYSFKNNVKQENGSRSEAIISKVDSMNKASGKNTNGWLLYDPPSPENEAQFEPGSFNASTSPYFYNLPNTSKSFYDSIPMEDRNSNNSSPLHT
ncbi:hypothetical protein K502DRAFT_322759 [Neoconidiobolus thromboides FSU 785]|nr:hypothetical protein K502DRAFT_322759 [Neoconidiobolus thromboides FSU 785]